MTTIEARLQIIKEHEALRNQMAELRRLAQRIEKGGNIYQTEGELRAAFHQFRTALEAHSVREDELLLPILRELDGRGREGAELLETQHAAEHAALLEAVREAETQSSPRRLAAIVKALSRHISEHLDEEERFLLRPDVLPNRAKSLDA